MLYLGNSASCTLEPAVCFHITNCEHGTSCPPNSLFPKPSSLSSFPAWLWNSIRLRALPGASWGSQTRQSAVVSARFRSVNPNQRVRKRETVARDRQLPKPTREFALGRTHDNASSGAWSFTPSPQRTLSLAKGALPHPHTCHHGHEV
jgi:hypothetical protein